MSWKPPTTVLCTGYAKAPQGTAMQEQYKNVGAVLEIDPATGQVVNADFTFVTELARQFVIRLVVGYDLNQGTELLFRRLSEHYQAPSQLAVVAALRSAIQRYMEYKEQFRSPERCRVL